jgi:citrate lyase subunit beta/citryl-CoA lyase
MPRRAKPIRTLLFVPGNNVEWMRKAPKYGADALILDLEDAVPPGEKVKARDTVRMMLEELGKAGQTLFVRINDLDTGLAEGDLEAITCPYLYCAAVPKVKAPEDITIVDGLLTHFERKAGLENGTVLINPLLETAQGLRLAYEVAISSPRVAHMGGGTGKDGDVARAIGFQWTEDGVEALYILSKVLLDARAANVPYPMGGRGWWDIRDLKGLRAESIRTRQIGYTGMILIHPYHVPVVNEVFTPTKEELEHFRGVIAAMEEGEKHGKAAVTYGGVMVDIAHLKQARDMLQWAKELGVV